MKMKKTLIACAVACAASSAHADSSVTLFGVAEANFGAWRNLNAAPVSASNPFGAAVDTKTSVGAVPYGPNASRFGLKGMEDLGGGLTANFILESQFNMATGAGVARLFHRQANVGLKSDTWGQLRMGRIYSAWNDIASNAAPGYGDTYDPFVRVWHIGGPVPLGSPVPNAKGQVTGLAGAVGTNNDVGNPQNWSQVRMDNSIRYDTPVLLGGLTLSAQIGLDDANHTPTAMSFSALYEKGPLRTGIAYYRQHTLSQYNVITQAYDPNLSRGGMTETYTAALNYDFGWAKLMTMVGQSKYDLFSITTDNGAGKRITSTEWSVGAQIPIGPFWALKPSIAGSNSAALPGSDIGAAMEVQYALSKRTILYVAYSWSNYGELLHGQSQRTSYIAAGGMRHLF